MRQNSGSAIPDQIRKAAGGSAITRAVSDGLGAARTGWDADVCPHTPGSAAARWWHQAFWSVRWMTAPDEIADGYRVLPDRRIAN